MEANDLKVLELSFTSPGAAGTFILGPVVANGPTYAGGAQAEALYPPPARGQGWFVIDPRFHRIVVFATLQGATGGTLDVYFQNSPDQSILGSANANWYDKAHYPQIAAAAGATSYAMSFSKTNPSSGIVVVGLNLTPALAANSKVDGDWGQFWRVLIVAGAGTTAGAAQKLKVIASP